MVTLDVEMPNMSGLETIAEIRKLHPKLPIIMFSTLTERGANTTLDALALSAGLFFPRTRRVALPGDGPIPTGACSGNYHLPESRSGLRWDGQSVSTVVNRELLKRVGRIRELPSSPAVLKPLLELMRQPTNLVDINELNGTIPSKTVQRETRSLLLPT